MTRATLGLSPSRCACALLAALCACTEPASPPEGLGRASRALGGALPDAVDDTFTVVAESMSVELDVLRNDSTAPDTGEVLSVTSVTQPANGTVTFTANLVRFTPSSGFRGTTTFLYTAHDGVDGADTATVTVQVQPNSPPDAVDDSFSVVNLGTSVVLDLLANDTSAPDVGEALSVTSVTQPASGGTVTLSAEVRFTPAAGFTGPATFTYTLADGHGGIDTATVVLSVTAPKGTACTLSTECDSGHCVDGVCCDLACGDGSPDDCQACSVAAGAAVNGSCGALIPSLAAKVVCRPAAGVCDLPETCRETSTSCPDDARAEAGVECRASRGDCDLAEACTGAAVDCPADALASAGTACASDALSCTLDRCDGAGRCTHALSTGCLIEGACVAAGAADPDNACRACDPATSPVAYVDRPSGLSCTDDGVDTTDDLCDGAGACVHPAKGACTIGGVTYARGAKDPANPCQACDPSANAQGWTARASGFPCGGDSLDCTADACDGAGSCAHHLYTGCLIDDACVAGGAADPSNACRACLPALSTTAWSNRAAGLSCPDDGQPTTDDRCDGAGVCTHTAAGECLIGGVAYRSGAANPSNPCQSCEPSKSATAWTARPDDFPCGEGGACGTLHDEPACLCPPGAYEKAKWACERCPAGTFRADAGGVGPSACAPCPAEHYGPVAGAFEAAACLACPAGTTAEPGASGCRACSAGTAGRGTAGSGCVPCSAGSSAPQAGLAQCMPCPPGTFTPYDPAGATACLDCPAGSYSAMMMSDRCFECRAGYFSAEAGAATCSACPAGTYANASGKTQCDRCPKGTAQSGTGASACQPCAAGTYADTTGRETCLDCAPGHYGPSGGAEACVACAPGTYAAAAKQIVCQECAAGTQQSQPGQTSCLACVSGTYAPVARQAACQSCPAGFTSGAGALLCTPVCGDGVRVGGEECDDGNLNADDGCSPACTLGADWACPFDGGPCVTVCTIGATKHLAGDLAPDNECLACDPTRSATEWSKRPVGTPCAADALSCTQDRCNAAGVCEHAVAEACLVEGVCVAAGAEVSGNACRTCEPLRSRSDYSDTARGLACDDDGDPRTDDLCDGMGTCVHPLRGECVIGGTRYASNEANPANGCQACDPATSVSAWTARVSGFPCEADGMDCTWDLCDGAGICQHRLVTGCLVGGRCVAATAEDPESACRACIPPQATDRYSNVPDGSPCGDDGDPQTQDTCQAGACGHAPVAKAESSGCGVTGRGEPLGLALLGLLLVAFLVPRRSLGEMERGR